VEGASGKVRRLRKGRNTWMARRAIVVGVAWPGRGRRAVARAPDSAWVYELTPIIGGGARTEELTLPRKVGTMSARQSGPQALPSVLPSSSKRVGFRNPLKSPMRTARRWPL
jgi:hypothetical protein